MRSDHQNANVWPDHRDACLTTTCAVRPGHFDAWYGYHDVWSATECLVPIPGCVVPILRCLDRPPQHAIGPPGCVADHQYAWQTSKRRGQTTTMCGRPTKMCCPVCRICGPSIRMRTPPIRNAWSPTSSWRLEHQDARTGHHGAARRSPQTRATLSMWRDVILSEGPV